MEHGPGRPPSRASLPACQPAASRGPGGRDMIDLHAICTTWQALDHHSHVCLRIQVIFLFSCFFCPDGQTDLASLLLQFHAQCNCEFRLAYKTLGNIHELPCQQLPHSQDYVPIRLCITSEHWRRVGKQICSSPAVPPNSMPDSTPRMSPGQCAQSQAAA